MLYIDYLETLTECPFCIREHNRIILENENAFLTYSLAPYHKYHMLVIPKRHVETFLEITNKEICDIDLLIQSGARILELLGQDDYTVLVRNGDDSGKSIRHMHYHLIPEVRIGNNDSGGGHRQLLTGGDVNELMLEFEEVKSRL